jgi:hypothetical protein
MNELGTFHQNLIVMDTSITKILCYLGYVNPY